MKWTLMYQTFLPFVLVLHLFSLTACDDHQPGAFAKTTPATRNAPLVFTIKHDVPLRSYFAFMDSLIAHLDTVLAYPVNEHQIVRHNPWLIDTLENTDYYHLMDKGIFIEDPQSMLALRKGETLQIPDSLQTDSLSRKMAATVIDLNIPEYRLRILEEGEARYSFVVRVGRNEKKYLAMAGQVVDLRTKTGSGQIVRINKKPTFINPSNNQRYHSTKRDDGRRTKLPNIPWLEPVLDGHRFGQLIHPTTNLETLGKAYSNGCIGLRESDMWRLYYHAPVGTKVEVRYDLEIVADNGDTIILKNIYPGYEKARQRKEIIAAAVARIQASGETTAVCDCRTNNQEEND